MKSIGYNEIKHTKHVSIEYKQTELALMIGEALTRNTNIKLFKRVGKLK